MKKSIDLHGCIGIKVLSDEWAPVVNKGNVAICSPTAPINNGDVVYILRKGKQRGGEFRQAAIDKKKHVSLLLPIGAQYRSAVLPLIPKNLACFHKILGVVWN